MISYISIIHVVTALRFDTRLKTLTQHKPMTIHVNQISTYQTLDMYKVYTNQLWKM